jgi:hypothetical protein
MTMSGFAYHGHFIGLEPAKSKDRWEAQVVVEVHAKGQVERIWYHEPDLSFATREEALEASREFGMKMVDNFTVPAYGEGDYQGPA